MSPYPKAEGTPMSAENAKTASGDEHPSLGDAIASRFGLRRVPNLWVWNADDEYHDGVPFGGWQHRGEGYRSGGDAPLNASDLPVYVLDPDAFAAALASASEEEREAAARGLCASRMHARQNATHPCAACRVLADRVLAASRGVLIPKEPAPGASTNLGRATAMLRPDAP